MKYLKYTISIISIILSSYFVITINKLNILPNKYLILIVLLLLLLNLLGIKIHKKNKSKKIISFVAYALILIITTIGIIYTNTTINFLKKGFNNNKEIKTYNVLILKSNNYDSLKQLIMKLLIGIIAGFLILCLCCCKSVTVNAVNPDCMASAEFNGDLLECSIRMAEVLK